MIENRFQVREARVGDALGIAMVHVRMWQKAYRGQVPDSFLDEMSIEKRFKIWKKSLEEQKEGNYTFVVENNGFIAGWCAGGINRDKDVGLKVGELGGIYVHPDYAGKGLGSMLMNNFLNVLRSDGYEKATLWVLDTNEKTRKWYEFKGWKEEGKVKVEPREGFELRELRYIIDL